MKAYGRLLLSTLLALGPCLASAQVPVSAATQHETFLSSPDARLVRNKKLVYDFWREVVDAGQIDQIDKYVAENYIQHNPTVATGRRALAEQIARNVKRQAAQAQDYWVEGTRIELTVSLGCSTLLAAESAESLLRRADNALYVAKREGRNRLAMAG